MSETLRPESRQASLFALYGPEAGRTIIASLRRLISLFEDECILDWEDVERRSRLSRKTILRLIELGEFPARVSLSEGSTGWLRSEFEAWLTSHSSASRK